MKMLWNTYTMERMKNDGNALEYYGILWRTMKTLRNTTENNENALAYYGIPWKTMKMLWNTMKNNGTPAVLIAFHMFP
jgi:hypothetical protein